MPILTLTKYFYCRQLKSQELYQDVCEEDLSAAEENSLNNSQPILAYHYSSDEDSPAEGSSDRSHGMSASATDSFSAHQPAPPPLPLPPPHKSTSFNIEEVLHYPVKGLRVYLPQEAGQTPPTASSHYAPLDHGAENLVEFRSLPRSLGKSAGRGVPIERISPYSRPWAPPVGTLVTNSQNASNSKLSSGRASPEMDALDNLLMKRSIFSGGSANREACSSDQDGSDASTCKATYSETNMPKSSTTSGSTPRERELAKALKQLSSTLRHLQHHTAELENRTRQLESEFNVSKSDMVHLQEATEGIRKDVKKLFETVTLVSQEASKAKRDYALQRQVGLKLLNAILSQKAIAVRKFLLHCFYLTIKLFISYFNTNDAVRNKLINIACWNLQFLISHLKF